MDNYIVSARKYRPDTFESVVGQHALTVTLKNAITNGRLAHSYLFCGPRGVGKTTCARIFAKTINCLNPRENGEACNECESCKAFNEQRSLNIHELDAASNNSVDGIRELTEQVRIPPQIGKYKVFIIDEVHMLSTAAFNAFLKTLEEPPAYVIFILATTEKHKILPTILSRCQIYDFNRMEVNDIVNHLKYVAKTEGITFEENALNMIAQKADGGMRDALSIFDQVCSFTNGNITYAQVIENLNILDYEYYFKLTDLFLEKKITNILLILNEVLSKGFQANQFIGGLASHFRDLLVSKDESTVKLLEVAENVREQYRQQAKKCSTKFLFKALKLCNNCDLNYRASKNKRLLVEITLIEVAQADDDESAGRSPKKLKPIFSKEPSAQVVGVTHKAVENTTQQKTVVASANNYQQQNVATANRVSENKPTYSSAANTAPKRIIPTISIRLGNNNAQQDFAKKETEQTKTHLATENYGNEPVDEAALQLPWIKFANLLPKADTAMSARMKIIKPKLVDSSLIEIVVENALVQKDFQNIEAQILNYLRKELRNGSLRLNIKLADKQTQRQAYTPKEQMDAMIKRYPAFGKFVKELSLELV